MATTDEQQSQDMVLALANELSARRSCTVTPAVFGDAVGKAAMRPIGHGARVRQVYVQHLKDTVTTGLVAIHFFPSGGAEKAIVEIYDGTDTMSLLVHGLTGRVENRDGVIRDPEAFLFRDATGEKVEER